MKSVETGGHTVALGPAGATIYDEGLGEELKRKYKGHPDVVVCEKSYIGLNDGTHRYTFSGVDLTNIKPRPSAGTWVEVRPGRYALRPATPKDST